jgi:RNA polymerase sigma factor (sigma-70 family)
MRAHGVSTSKAILSVRGLGSRGDDVLRGMAARGDAEAFGAIYERHHQSLYRYCRSILGDDDDARDALHNTMAKAWEALRRDEPDVPLRAWLFRIAHNEALSLARGRRPHRDLDETHAVSAGTVEETFAVRQRLAELRADLAALPERQRSALVLRELCGLGHDEIAEVLVISAATARQAIYEARVGLHEAALGREMTCVAVQRALSDGDARTRRRRRIRGHLRSCQACSAFEGLLRQRPGELAALVPVLPAAAAAGVFGRLLPHAGAGAGSSAAAGTAGGLGALANLTSGVVAKLAVAVVVIVGGATEVGRVVGPTPPAATAATAPSTARAPVGADQLPPFTPEWAAGAARASAVSTAVGHRSHAAADARPVGRGTTESPATAGEPGADPAGVPATDASVEHGSDREPQTLTTVSDPAQAALTEQRPPGLPVAAPDRSDDAQAGSDPASSTGPVVTPQRQSPAADAGAAAANEASVESPASRTAIEPPASRTANDPPVPVPSAPAGNGRPASPAVPARSGDRPQDAVGEQRRPAESRPAVEPERTVESRRAVELDRAVETRPAVESRAAPDPPRRPQEVPSAPQRRAAGPSRDPSECPSPEQGPPTLASEAHGPAGAGDSREQPRIAVASPPPKAPRPVEPAQVGNEVAKGGDGSAPAVVGQPAAPAQGQPPSRHQP